MAEKSPARGKKKVGPRTTVRFVRTCYCGARYNRGEVATFGAAVADQLIKKGFAVDTAAKPVA